MCFIMFTKCRIKIFSSIKIFYFSCTCTEWVHLIWPICLEKLYLNMIWITVEGVFHVMSGYTIHITFILRGKSTFIRLDTVHDDTVLQNKYTMDRIDEWKEKKHFFCVIIFFIFPQMPYVNMAHIYSSFEPYIIVISKHIVLQHDISK